MQVTWGRDFGASGFRSRRRPHGYTSDGRVAPRAAAPSATSDAQLVGAQSTRPTTYTTSPATPATAVASNAWPGDDRPIAPAIGAATTPSASAGEPARSAERTAVGVGNAADPAAQDHERGDRGDEVRAAPREREALHAEVREQHEREHDVEPVLERVEDERRARVLQRVERAHRVEVHRERNEADRERLQRVGGDDGVVRVNWWRTITPSIGCASTANSTDAGSTSTTM